MVRHLREGEGGKQEDSGTQQPALIGTGSNKVVFMKNSCPFSYCTSLRDAPTEAQAPWSPCSTTREAAAVRSPRTPQTEWPPHG